MTDGRADRSTAHGSSATVAHAPRRRPRAWATVVGSLALFCVVFQLIAFQLVTGHDPALGGAQQPAGYHKAAPAKAAPVALRPAPAPIVSATS